MTKTLLYYPSIEIPDEAWMKNTILYWDKIASIVPHEGYALPPNVEKLCAFECFTPVYPEQVFEKHANAFLDTLERRLYDLPRRDPEPAYIHENKMYYAHGLAVMEGHPEIRALFENYHCDKDGWRCIGKKTLTAYIKTMAEFAVHDRPDMRIGTDKLTDYNRFKDGYGSPADAGVMLEVLFDRMLPIPHPDTPLEELLAFKKQHAKQLIDFQGELALLQGRLCACQKENDYLTVWADFKEKIKEAKTVAENSLSDCCIRYVTGSLKTGLHSFLAPGLLVDAGMNLANLAEFWNTSVISKAFAVGVAADVGVHITKAVVNDISRKRNCQKSNFAFVMHAQKGGMCGMK